MSRWIVWLGPVLIVLVSAVLYSDSGDHSRLTEDRAVVWDNTAVTGESFGPALRGYFYTNERSFHPAIRPLSTIVNRSTYARFGQSRTGFQWAQILLHGLAAALLAVTIGKTLRAPIAGFVAGLVFVCHPGLTNSVLRLAGISETLALCFSMVALLAANRAFAPKDPRDRNHRLSLSICWLAVLLAIWSKEIAIVIVPALWLWAATVSRNRSSQTAKQDRLSDPVTLSVGVLVAVLVALGFRTLSIGSLPDTVHLTSEVYSDTGDPFASRLLAGLAAIPTYARLVFFPNKLGVTYDFIGFLRGGALQLGWILGSLTIVALLVGVVTAWVRREAKAVLWGSITLGSLIASLGVLVPTGDYLNERCIYFLLPGVLALIAWVATRLTEDRSAAWMGTTVAVVGIVLAVILGARTMNRVGDFANQEKLLRAQIETYPESARARFDLGSLFLSRGNLDRARSEYEVALAQDPELWMAWANVGVTYARQDALSLAIRAYSRALQGMKGRPGYRGEEARTRFNSAIVLMKQNRNREASEELLHAVEVFPNHIRAHANLGFIFSNDPGYDDQAFYHLGRAMDLEADPEKRKVLADVVRQINIRRGDIDTKRQERIDAGLLEEPAPDDPESPTNPD